MTKREYIKGAFCIFLQERGVLYDRLELSCSGGTWYGRVYKKQKLTATYLIVFTTKGNDGYFWAEQIINHK